MPNPWWMTLRHYDFSVVADPTNERMYLDCYVTDSGTGTPLYGSPHALSLNYDPTGSATLQGTIYDSDVNYLILLSTNSSAFMQRVQWALTLSQGSFLWVSGSPSTATGSYPYTVDEFRIFPLSPEPSVVPAELRLPEITAEMPEELRKALERRREHQARLQEVRLRAAPKR